MRHRAGKHLQCEACLIEQVRISGKKVEYTKTKQGLSSTAGMVQATSD